MANGPVASSSSPCFSKLASWACAQRSSVVERVTKQCLFKIMDEKWFEMMRIDSTFYCSHPIRRMSHPQNVLPNVLEPWLDQQFRAHLLGSLSLTVSLMSWHFSVSRNLTALEESEAVARWCWMVAALRAMDRGEISIHCSPSFQTSSTSIFFHTFPICKVQWQSSRGTWLWIELSMSYDKSEHQTPAGFPGFSFVLGAISRMLEVHLDASCISFSVGAIT